MSNQTTLQAVIVDMESPQKALNLFELALFNADGTPKTIPDGLEPAEAHPDSVATTIEELVDDFNSLLAKFRAAGHLSA